MPFFTMQQVSSTYLFQSRGLVGADLSASSSKNSLSSSCHSPLSLSSLWRYPCQPAGSLHPPGFSAPSGPASAAWSGCPSEVWLELVQSSVPAPAPAMLPVVDTIAAVEEGARQLSEEDAEDLRGRVRGILRHVKPPKDNLTKE